MILLGLTGFAQSGKDTVADYLVEKYGFVKMSFAAKLKECVLKLDPLVEMDAIANKKSKGPGGVFIRLSDLVRHEGGWDNAKLHTEVRRLLQVFGTEVGRELLGQNVWVDLLTKEVNAMRAGHNMYVDEVMDAHHLKIVITDCRFPNEVDRIRNWNGKVVRVERPGVGPLNSHASEKANELEVDYILPNESTIQYLHLCLDEMINKIIQHA